MIKIIKKATFLMFCILMISCSSTKTFQSFFNEHKNDMGVTAFQVPNFMKALLGTISPEMNGLFNNIQDFKFLTFNEISSDKKTLLIQQMNAVTASNYKDILRKNTLDKTKIVSVIEDGDKVSEAIIFNTTLAKSSVFYLKGSFDPNTLKKVSETDGFENLSTKLLKQNFTPTTPGFNSGY